MKHPTSETWALFASDMLPAEERQSLAAHLNECGTCAAEVEQLRKTIDRLTQFDFPAQRKARWNRDTLRWAAAAALLLAAGFLAGRMQSDSQPLARHRAAIESSVRASMENAWMERLRASETRTAQLLAEMEARLADGAEARTGRAFADLVGEFDRALVAERQKNASALESLRQRMENDLRWLRTDLETVASHADDRLRLASFQLRQLTADAMTNP